MNTAQINIALFIIFVISSDRIETASLRARPRLPDFITAATTLARCSSEQQAAIGDFSCCR
jgi:hypothetical protein